MKHSLNRNNKLDTQTLDLHRLVWTLLDCQSKVNKERLAVVKQLAAGISHHYNNALQIILTAAELASRRPDVSSSVKADLARIIKHSEEAAELGRQLLDFSGQSIVSKQSVDLVNLIEETIKQLESSLAENIQVVLNIDKSGIDSYNLRVNPAQIRQVLINLAANAQDAMPEGGVLQFRLSTLGLTRPRFSSKEMSGRWIVLSISDSGEGVAENELPHIFEPFYTTKEVGEGTGLGLAQVYGIMTQHGGNIEVESHLGQGTTFTLYLPIQPLPRKAMSQKEIEKRGFQEHVEILN